jgi:hypothetical protein
MSNYNFILHFSFKFYIGKFCTFLHYYRERKHYLARMLYNHYYTRYTRPQRVDKHQGIEHAH